MPYRNTAAPSSASDYEPGLSVSMKLDELPASDGAVLLDELTVKVVTLYQQQSGLTKIDRLWPLLHHRHVCGTDGARRSHEPAALGPHQLARPVHLLQGHAGSPADSPGEPGRRAAAAPLVAIDLTQPAACKPNPTLGVRSWDTPCSGLHTVKVCPADAYRHLQKDGLNLGTPLACTALSTPLPWFDEERHGRSDPEMHQAKKGRALLSRFTA